MNDRRRSWRTGLAHECLLHRHTGKTIEVQTVDLGPGGMRVKTDRPLAIDETFDFELPDRARINGRARVVDERGYRVYGLRFDKLGDEARAEIALLAQEAAPSSSAPER